MPDDTITLPTVGEVLLEEFLIPLEITPYRLSKDLGVSTSSILDLVHGKRKVTVEMALRLAKYFGTSSRFWINMQNELDLREAQDKLADDLAKIPHCKRIAELPSTAVPQCGWSEWDSSIIFIKVK